jgi:cardiolipin synthase
MTENPWNIPNALALFRLLGSLALVGVGVSGHRTPFAWLLLALLISDWLDGKLAIWLDQRTIFGARLDSAADAAMYAALLFGLLWLEAEFVWHEWPWIAAALGSFAISAATGWVKYRRFPSYHTRMAKTSWLLVGIAAFTIFAGGPPWPARVAMAVVVAVNLEATAMTFILPRWSANVPSILHAWRRRDAAPAPSDQPINQERE